MRGGATEMHPYCTPEVQNMERTMARERITLTKEIIKQLELKPKRYEVWDAEIRKLFVRVSPTGVKSFVVQLARTKKVHIGDALTLPLPEARRKAEKVIGEGANNSLCKIGNKQLLINQVTFSQFFYNNYQTKLLAKAKAKNQLCSSPKKQVRLPEDYRQVERHFKFIFNRPIRQAISLIEIENWCDERRGTHKNATLNRTITSLSMVFNLALKQKVIEIHPFKGELESLETPERVRYLSDEEETKLFNALIGRDKEYRDKRLRTNAHRKKRRLPTYPDKPYFGDHLLPMVILGQQIGLRKGNLAAIKKSDIFLDKRAIHLPLTKNGEYKVVMLNDVAYDVISKWLEQTTPLNSDYLFPSPKNQSTHIQNPKSAWKAILRKKGVKITNFTWHDLRHDFASKLASAGVSLYAVADCLGHKSIKQTMKYAHLSPDYIESSVGKLVSRAKEVINLKAHYTSFHELPEN